MKFITEDDLRDLYKIEPFTDYVIEPGTRITPGARQFLADRGILMFDDAPKDSKNNAKAVQARPAPELKNKRIHLSLKSMEAELLATAQELLGLDVILAQKAAELCKCFAGIRNAVGDKIGAYDLVCQKCTGINEDNFSDDMDDCFEITEFHIQLEKGREIVLLHELRCALRETELDLMEFFDGCDTEHSQREEIVKRVHQMINTLSQLICIAAGGEKCQKKA